MRRVQNTHPSLYDEFADYTTFVANDLSLLDVPSLWSSGAALNDMVEALGRLDGSDSRRSMTEPLEPDVLSQLRSLLRDHTTFIMGFAEAQELAARAAALRLLDIPPAELAHRTRGVLAPMLRASSLLAQHARTLIQTIDRALDKADDFTAALVGAGVTTATPSIVAIGRAAAPYLETLAVGAAVSGVNILNLIGDPNAETIRAAILYLAENANALAAFASHDEQLSAWLTWLVSEIRRNIPPKHGAS